jgi:hypothetical protein
MALLHRFTSVFIVVTLLASVGCGATARLAVADGTGPNPVLPPPKKTLLPKYTSSAQRDGRQERRQQPLKA